MPRRHDCPEGEFYCPDCGFCKPRDQFYWVDDIRYAAGEKRSAYCKPHQDARVRQSEAKSLTMIESRRARQRAYMERKTAARQAEREAERAKTGDTTYARGDITVRDAAELLGRSKKGVSDLQAKGLLPKPLTRAAVEAYIAGQQASDKE